MSVRYLKGVFFGLLIVLLLADNGYCLFRDDVDPQQVKSKVKIKRHKDKQKKMNQLRKKADKEAEQFKQKAKDDQSGVIKGKGSKGSAGALTKEETVPVRIKTTPEGFKRLSRDEVVSPVKKPKLKAKTAKPAEAKKKPRSPRGFIIFLIVICAIGFYIYKRGKE